LTFQAIILEEIRKASNLVVTSAKKEALTPEMLKKSFINTKDNQERDEQVCRAYNDGYSQHAIAECLGFSQPYINKIIRKRRGN